MKNILALLITIIFLGITIPFGIAADDRCPLTGYTYAFEADGLQFELSGFDCTFGPGCEATCDLWYGDFEIGPKYRMRLPFVCFQDGSVLLTFDKIEIPCSLNIAGNLECLIVDVSNYECYDIGNETWCVPDVGVVFNFDHE